MLETFQNDLPLLPDRHPEKDFFIADVFENVPFKDDIASMESPLFSLSKKLDFRQLQYAKDNIKITIAPSTYGLPTIFDKDVLLYCGSLLMEQLNICDKESKKYAKQVLEQQREALIREGKSCQETDTMLDNSDTYTYAYKQAQQQCAPPPKTLRISSHDLLVATN